MRFDPQAGLTNPRDGDDNPSRRRRGRLGQEAVISSIGTVLDLSPDGLRAMCRRLPEEGEIAIQITGLGGELEVMGRMVWSKRHGRSKFEVGIEFVDVSGDLARQINDLAMINRHRLWG
jgi:hypothetical protein